MSKAIDEPAPAAGRGKTIRRLAAVGLAVAFGWFVLSEHRSVSVAIEAIRNVGRVDVCIGMLLVIGALWNQAAFHAASQRAAGGNVRASEMVVPVAAAAFANAVVKSGAMAGLAAMVSAARRSGRSRSSTVSGYMLVNVLGHVAFALTLAIGMVMLSLSGRFTHVDAVAAAIFGVLSLAQFLIIAAAFRTRDTLHRVQQFPARMLGRFRGRRIGQNTDRTESTELNVRTDELFESVQIIRRSPRAIGLASGYALGVEVFGIAQLWLVLHALHANVSLAVPVVAYGISVLFGIVGFLPAGLGTVEIGLGAVLESYGMTRSGAIAAVVLYRVLELWIPLALGLFATQRLARATQ